MAVLQIFSELPLAKIKKCKIYPSVIPSLLYAYRYISKNLKIRKSKLLQGTINKQ